MAWFNGLTILDLLRLAARADVDRHKTLEKAFEWEHNRRLEIGKWCLASAAALVVGDMALFAKGSPPSAAVLNGAGALAGILLILGLGALISGRSIAARYCQTLELTERMVEFRPFLELLRSRGKL